jgi:hypothetical protein
LKLRDKYSSEEIRRYIDPYIQKIRRNEKDILAEITKLVESHIHCIEKADKMDTKNEKIEAVRDLYEQAMDKDNPKRDRIKLEQEMFGRIANKVCSYDLMDNEKYECIEPCLEILNETFNETEQEVELKRLKTFNSLLTSPMHMNSQFSRRASSMVRDKSM